MKVVKLLLLFWGVEAPYQMDGLALYFPNSYSQVKTTSPSFGCWT